MVIILPVNGAAVCSVGAGGDITQRKPPKKQSQQENS